MLQERIGDTTAWMQEVERLRRQSRGRPPWMAEVSIMQDVHMDVSGRVALGTKTEQ